MIGLSRGRIAADQRGVVLISTLLLLIVMTIFAMSMFRSFGVQERIAGNIREKQRALQTANGAQQFAEYWLSSLTTSTPVTVTCGAVQPGTMTSTQICSISDILSNVVAGGVTTVPWIVSGAEVGFTYDPGNAIVPTATAGASTYAALPRFYISDVGASADNTGEVYRVDAWGYAATTSTVAVVESTYLLKPTVKCLSCPP